MPRFLKGQRLLRRVLGTLLDDATRVLVRMGHRLGRPALATIPVSAVMLSRLQTVNIDQPLEDRIALLFGSRLCHAYPLARSGLTLTCAQPTSLRAPQRGQGSRSTRRLSICSSLNAALAASLKH